MFYSLSFKRRPAMGMTVLELRGHDTDIEIKIISRHGKRERRVIARSLFRQLAPWIRHFTEAAMDHTGKGVIFSRRAKERGVRQFSSAPVTTRRGAYGFEIRMRRLALGITQQDLAAQLGVRRSHLSDLERGIFLPRRNLQEKIEHLLGQSPHLRMSG